MRYPENLLLDHTVSLEKLSHISTNSVKPIIFARNGGFLSHGGTHKNHPFSRGLSTVNQPFFFWFFDGFPMGDPPSGRHLWDATEACDGGLMTGLFIRKAAQTVTEMTHLADVVNGQLINRFTINIWIKINR